MNIFTCINTSCSYKRNFCIIFILKYFQFTYNFRNKLFKRIIIIKYLFLFKTQMSSGLWTFNNNCIRKIIVIGFPFFTDYFCCPC